MKVKYNGHDVEVKNVIGDLMVIWDDGIKVVSEKDVAPATEEEPKEEAPKKRTRKNAVNG